MLELELEVLLTLLLEVVVTEDEVLLLLVTLVLLLVALVELLELLLELLELELLPGKTRKTRRKAQGIQMKCCKS